MISTIVFTAFPLAFFIGALYWARGWRAAGTPGAWPVTAMLTAFGISFSAYNNGLRHVEDSIRPLLSHLLSNSATLAAAASVSVFLLDLNAKSNKDRQGVRPRVILLAAAVAVMFAMYALTPSSKLWVEDAPHGVAPSQPLTLTVYALVYIVYLGFAVLDCLRQTWRKARGEERQSLRIGLRTVAAGCFLALVYVAFKVFTITTVLAGTVVVARDQKCTSLLTPADCAFTVTTPALSALLVTIGLTMPVVTWKVRQMQRLRWERKATEDILPLWTVFTEAFPEIVLRHVDVENAVSDLTLHRRVIEVLDGILCVRAYRSRLVQDRATQILTAQGHSPEAIEARVEAAVLVDALRAIREGQDREEDPAPAAPGTHARDGDLRAEAEWLRSVAKTFVANTPKPTVTVGAPEA